MNRSKLLLENLFESALQYRGDPAEHPVRRYAHKVFAMLERDEELDRLPMERAELQERLTEEARGYFYKIPQVAPDAESYVRHQGKQDIDRMLGLFDAVVAADAERAQRRAQQPGRAVPRPAPRRTEWLEELDLG